MRILYYSFSCEPNAGSDEGLGWLWPFYMRTDHEVYVVTRKDREPQIERYLSEHNITNMHFFYCDIPNWMNFYYKTGKGFLVYQKLWQYPAYSMIKKLHKIYQFDLIHHVSTSDFRLIGFLYKINTRYLLGPIGGAQQTPKPLKYYTRHNRAEEDIRSLINKITMRNPRYKRAINKADSIFFTNRETYDFLLPHIKNKQKCYLLLDVAIEKEKVLMTDRIARLSNQPEKIMTFIWSGRMVFRKGLSLLIDALSIVDSELKYQVILCGDGPESDYLKESCNKKNLNKKVIFTGKLSYENMQKYYDKADLFIFPSLRETTGTVLVEAFSHGLPVITLNQGGAALMVTNQEGFLISGNSREEYIMKLAEIMEECIRKPELVREKGLAAYKKVLDNYTWDKKISFMNEIYKKQ